MKKRELKADDFLRRCDHEIGPDWHQCQNLAVIERTIALGNGSPSTTAYCGQHKRYGMNPKNFRPYRLIGFAEIRK